jgi:hypothetical protein
LNRKEQTVLLQPAPPARFARATISYHAVCYLQARRHVLHGCIPLAPPPIRYCLWQKKSPCFHFNPDFAQTQPFLNRIFRFFEISSLFIPKCSCGREKAHVSDQKHPGDASRALKRNQKGLATRADVRL